MDVKMPDLDGIEATRRIVAEAGDETAVLVLTTFDADEYIYNALRAGASGFLLKDVPAEQLIEAVRIVARGDALIAPAVTRRLVEAFIRTAPAQRARRDCATSRRARSRCSPWSRAAGRTAEIAADLVLSEATVKTHVKHVLAKLGARDRVQAVVFAYEAGLVTPRG